MQIHNIKITNFKSIYNTQEFDFDSLEGMVKLSGPIGSGKTTLGEAIIWGLFGTVKKQTNTGLVAWNMNNCEVEMNITSKNKDIHILRNSSLPLIIEVEGKKIVASNKRNTQAILEEELLDVSKMTVERMCIISFNNFNSIANMSPGETKAFLDDVFEFKIFTDYNNEIIDERKNDINENTKLKAVYEENLSQIEHLKQKKINQSSELKVSVNVEKLNEERQKLLSEGIDKKTEKEKLTEEKASKKHDNDEKIKDLIKSMSETAVLGKQEKTKYNQLKSGICPTCGAKIEQKEIDGFKEKMLEYAEKYKQLKAKKDRIEEDNIIIDDKYNEKIKAIDNNINDIKKSINSIDSKINIYKNNLKVINENYDQLIKEYEAKAAEAKKKIDLYDVDIAQWNEMNELFTKTLRYKLLETLIPQINRSIQFFTNKIYQGFRIEFDEEFKSHIYVDSFEKEISYNNLSTGQKKTLDLAIIFGILHNIISNVDINVLFLDELFSNMDTDTRNIMLNLLNESVGKTKTVFIINHAEMADDYFSHKIRVSLQPKIIISPQRKIGEITVKTSKYEKIF